MFQSSGAHSLAREHATPDTHCIDTEIQTGLPETKNYVQYMVVL